MGLMLISACCNQSKCNCNCKCEGCECNKDKDTTAVAALDYEIVDKPQVDLKDFAVDKDGYVVLFDGKTLKGWRGYGKDEAPANWGVEDGAIHFKGSGSGEAQADGGGDLIFAHKFKNFDFEFEYKISKNGNSGVFYLAQEVKSNGEYLPIWQSASEFQVLDNDGHPDAKLGVDGNRQAASLYDMIPAKPQNACQNCHKCLQRHCHSRRRRKS